MWGRDASEQARGFYAFFGGELSVGSGLLDAEKIPSEACRSMPRPPPGAHKSQGAGAPQTPCLLHPPPHILQQECSSPASPRHHVQTVHCHLPDQQPQGFQHSLSHHPSHWPLSLQLRLRDPLPGGQWRIGKDQRLWQP